MSTPLTATTAPTGMHSSEFWGRLWRTGGIQAVVCLLIAYVVYGYQPQLGAPAEAVVAFYEGDRLRIRLELDRDLMSLMQQRIPRVPQT